MSALATPFAALLGMVIAWLVVRKNFAGKEALDFSSNLGGAVPGTILGIGFVLVFNKPPLALAIVVYALLALFFVLVVGKDGRERLIILLVGTSAGVLFTRLGAVQVYYLLGGLYLFLAVILFLSSKQLFGALFSVLLGLYVMSTNWANAIAKPIADFSRSIERGFWSNAIFQFSDHIKVLIQPPPSLLAIFLIFAGILLVQGLKQPAQRLVGGILALSIPCAMSFMEIPFALVGGAYLSLIHI